MFLPPLKQLPVLSWGAGWGGIARQQHKKGRFLWKRGSWMKSRWGRGEEGKLRASLWIPQRARGPGCSRKADTLCPGLLGSGFRRPKCARERVEGGGGCGCKDLPCWGVGRCSKGQFDTGRGP